MEDVGDSVQGSCALTHIGVLAPAALLENIERKEVACPQ